MDERRATTSVVVAESPYAEYATATGWVCMRLSYADLEIGQLLVTLLHVGDEGTGNAMFASLDLSHKIRLLRSVATVRTSGQWLERLKDAANRIENLGKSRNRFAHDVWALSPDDEVVKHQYKVEVGQAKPNQAPEVTTLAKTRLAVSDMFRIADEIDDAATDIRQLCMEYLIAVPWHTPSPDR